MQRMVLLLLLVANILYLLLGGAVFNSLEKESEDDTRVRTRNRTNEFLDTHQCVTQEELENLIKHIISAYDQGVLSLDNATSASNWNFHSSVFFSGTVVTTIGYGNIAPSTRGGRIFCMIYAIFGIPLMLVLLGGIGEWLRLVAERVDPQLNFCKGRPKVVKGMRLGFLLVLGLVLFLFVPAVIFMELEEWTFLESVYYGVITLTTVGLGDFVPGRSVEKIERAFYRMGIWLWIFIGLAWLATVLSALQELMQDFTSKMERTVSRRIAERKSDGAHKEDEEDHSGKEPHSKSNNAQGETLGEVDSNARPNGVNDKPSGIRVTWDGRWTVLQGVTTD